MFDHIASKLRKNGLEADGLWMHGLSSYNLAKHNNECDPDDNIVEHVFKIKWVDVSEPDAKTRDDSAIELGHCKCLYLPGSTKGGRELLNLLEVAEAYSGDLLEAISPIVNSEGGLDFKYPPLSNDIVYIEHIEVKPDYWDKGVGSAALYLLSNTIFPGAGIGVTLLDDDTPEFIKKLLINLDFYRAEKPSEDGLEVWVKNMA